MRTSVDGTWPKSGAGNDGDFIALLRTKGHWPQPGESLRSSAEIVTTANRPLLPEATTILGFHYRDGVVIAGDRRATAGGTVIYDRADKVIDIDASTVMAVAGSPATAFEMARVLQHSFQYYRRSQLQPLSLEAKVRQLGKLIKDNLALAIQGIGGVAPLLASREEKPDAEPRLYFYDALGAQFLAADFSVSGSGSAAARSVLHYVNRWSGKPTRVRDETESIRLALHLLDVAAESDTATGGVDRRSEIYPQVAILKRDGKRHAAESELRAAFAEAENAVSGQSRTMIDSI